MYEYKCKVLRVIDGDTVDVDIDLGFGVWLRKERVRIMGIDTPESRTRDKVEKKFGLASKAKLKELLKDGAILKTEVSKKGEDMKGKFGRILGDFILDDDRRVIVTLALGSHSTYAKAVTGVSASAIINDIILIIFLFSILSMHHMQ